MNRGECTRVEKSQNVKAGGAAGFVLANGDTEAKSIPSLIADPFALPGAAVTYSDGLVLKDWVSGQYTSRGSPERFSGEC